MPTPTLHPALVLATKSLPVREEVRPELTWKAQSESPSYSQQSAPQPSPPADPLEAPILQSPPAPDRAETALQPARNCWHKDRSAPQSPQNWRAFPPQSCDTL